MKMKMLATAAHPTAHYIQPRSTTHKALKRISWNKIETCKLTIKLRDVLPVGYTISFQLHKSSQSNKHSRSLNFNCHEEQT